ncbi:MAG: NADH-quinone oxidoreductase subunit C [Myxococcales bacterium]|nr:NADH-quinone oxidoreductase subunit C [Myxococcales bacterium]
MEAAEIFARLTAEVGDAVSAFTALGTRDPFCMVAPARWHDVAVLLRNDAALQFDFCQCITAVDWPKKSILQMVYHLYSYPLRHSFVVKADLPRDNPTIQSVADIWMAADWNEREQFDLLGVGFLGHPDLRRVLLPDDWVGYPLRKDYKEAAMYRDMPTSRPSTLDLLVVYDRATPAEKQKAMHPGAGDEGEQETTDE